MSEVETVRKTLAEAIQSTHDSDDSLEGAVLVGFVVVAEWMDPEGKRWLSSSDGSGNGEEGLVTWQTRGYLSERLYDWECVGEDDDA